MKQSYHWTLWRFWFLLLAIIHLFVSFDFFVARHR
jgi:hypothetical protein